MTKAGHGFRLLSRGRAAAADLQADTLPPLQVGHDLEQVAGGWIPTRAKHLMQALDMDLRVLCQCRKAHGCIDVITQQFLPQRKLGSQQAFDRILQQPLAECRVALYPRLHGLSEIPG